MVHTSRAAALGPLFVILAASCDRASDAPAAETGPISFAIRCQPDSSADFEIAVAALHSFFYEEARRQFEDITRRDPSCAMAWWGVAMTYYHPLWAPPSPEEMASGAAAAARARALGGQTDLERGFIEAIDAFYATDESAALGQQAPSCHGVRAHGSRAAAFRSRLEALRARYPDDVEVAVFTALSLLATADPTDRTYANQLAAAAILEPLFATRPAHPGVTHLLIHAYDYPSLARRGLAAARHYAALAPGVPHALHMPSHIFTRLGMWPESIDANLAAAAAARDYTARYYNKAVWYDELHALDYAVFAYLQSGQDRRAEQIADYVRGVSSFKEPNFAAAYAIGAIPARLALERRRWRDAAALEVQHPELVERFPFAVAHTQFARAIGAARLGDRPRAAAAVARLEEIATSMVGPEYKWWTAQVEIQRLAASGWLARADGDDARAIELLGQAAVLEDSAGTHPVTPGQILPAHEQLGDLLMELSRPAEALAHYQRSLAAFPGRLNSADGLARAAERVGDGIVARDSYRAVVRLAEAGGGRPEMVARARAYLGR